MDPYDYDAAVIRAAETLIDKRRTFRLDLDAGDLDIYVDALEKALVVRREINSPKAAGATTIEKPYPHEYLKPTSTPSITVGTQVRLTGVTMSSGKDGEVVTIESDGFVFGVPVGALEVIRQPFKRGEVVYGTSSGDTYVVFNDERYGKVDVVDVTAGVSGLDEDATDYERRYERRP